MENKDIAILTILFFITAIVCGVAITGMINDDSEEIDSLSSDLSTLQNNMDDVGILLLSIESEETGETYDSIILAEVLNRIKKLKNDIDDLEEDMEDLEDSNDKLFALIPVGAY